MNHSIFFRGAVLVACFVLWTCSFDDGTSQLKVILERIESHKSYDEKQYPLGYYTEDRFRSDAEFALTQIDALRQLNLDELSESDRISVALQLFVLQEQVDYFEFKSYLNPLLSDAGFHNDLAYEVRALDNKQQVEEYVKKLNALPMFVDQHLELLKKGIALGITQPRVIFEGYESTYNDHITQNPNDNFFYQPFLNLPPIYSVSQKDSLADVGKRLINEIVVPQFKRIKSFFENEYFPSARQSIGVSAIPNGEAYYLNRIAYYTTLDLTPEEVHQMGLREVERIRQEMMDIIKEIGFKGDFPLFLEYLRTDPQFYASSGEELLMIARDICKRIDAELPKLFKELPRMPYGVAPVPDAIAPKYTGGRYIPTSAGSTRPGFYWVNTFNLPSRPLYVLPSLSAHEAVPGHHLQMSWNSELGEQIPKFRRDLYLSAYGEGWGLYSEYLGNEMGIYSTPYESFGKLTYEMWRACRLVVDTGIHAFGWTRDEAVTFLKNNTALSIHEVNTEIDRYISWPGQALSYKVGELTIRRLREQAERELGEQFDIREFHHVILKEGTVTLTILEQLVESYISNIKSKNG